MKCPQCQIENPDGSKFCLECGARFKVPCPECGKPLPPAAKFCNECGHALQKPAKESSIDYHWFTEGFDTRDLREAKALLDILG